jgi:hypothetical protein
VLPCVTDDGEFELAHRVEQRAERREDDMRGKQVGRGYADRSRDFEILASGESGHLVDARPNCVDRLEKLFTDQRKNVAARVPEKEPRTESPLESIELSGDGRVLNAELRRSVRERARGSNSLKVPEPIPVDAV